MLVYITVMYSCQKCNLTKIKVQVPAREEEDIVTYTNKVAAHLSRDHDKRSPFCHITELTEVWIPISGDKIGGATKQ